MFTVFELTEALDDFTPNTATAIRNYAKENEIPIQTGKIKRGPKNYRNTYRLGDVLYAAQMRRGNVCAKPFPAQSSE